MRKRSGERVHTSVNGICSKPFIQPIGGGDSITCAKNLPTLGQAIDGQLPALPCTLARALSIAARVATGGYGRDYDAQRSVPGSCNAGDRTLSRVATRSR